MNKDNFPKITKEKMKGLGGQAYFQNLVINEWGWLYHKNEQDNDFGIDAYIEIVNNGNVSGKLIGVQIKYGNSYFKSKRNNRILYHGEQKHLNYYQNSNVPIIIILINDDFTKIYWSKFDIDLIWPVDNGWEIEILCDEINKNDIENITGPIIDYIDELKMLNSIQKILISADWYLIVIPKEDIESLNYTKIINHINFLSKNTRILEKKSQSMDICIFGYDDDPRELFEIPEVLKWLRNSLKKNIPWFYFLSTDEKNAGLILLFYSSLDKIEYKKVNNGYTLFSEGKDIGKFLEINYLILNNFMEKHGLDNELNKNICKNIMNKLEKQFYFP